MTPFQPLDPTAVYEPTQVVLEPDVVSQPETVTPAHPASFSDYGVNFSNYKVWMSIQIDPPNKDVNRGKPVDISFIPGDTCYFGEHRVCVNEYFDGLRTITLLTIHSGVGGEAQEFRHAIEGTGINRAGFSVEKVHEKIDSLSEAQVVIHQDGDQVGGFTLVGIVRIPPEHIQAYLNASITDSIALAIKLDPDLEEKIDPNSPLVAFETCGWKMIGEPWLPGITSTTGSIYVGIIQPSG
jgi:hypothetical protein